MSNTSVSKGEQSRSQSRPNPPRSDSNNEESGDFEAMVGSIGDSIKEYGGKHPAVVGFSIFLAGFYLGWKIKPW
ncbi:hypothetical protein VN12_13850 [Pirellula sp. SH-Sr6A]|uniref:hypothetical protein n=1 Tax=Pirellula sp. SH-Sr6A TaxID=1632865 RepID=UPI00078DF998|nr:hypothetical protein [Pirellula sp. SH-Sr6A]AMV33205.1 hypothetical protein VN12_13850 [Pirellula sp. SH-Sr6A]